MNFSEHDKLIPFGTGILNDEQPDFDWDNPQCDAKELKEHLIKIMKETGGVGLSANQIGINLRVFVFGQEPNIKACFNPRIVGASKETLVMKEGCLSLPGVWLSLTRPAAVVVTYQDEMNQPMAATFDGIEGRIFQHEYDHMIGGNFTKLASPLKMQRALTALKKQNRIAKANANV